MDMIEKGARAVCKLTYDLLDEDQRAQITPEEYVNRFWKTHTQETIVVIKAMRDPSEDMMDAALDDPNASYCDRCHHNGHIRNSGAPWVIYKAMIDKILEG